MGRRKYWMNFLTAGAFLLIGLGSLRGTSVWTFILSFIAGLIWADFFEYIYHKEILHWAGSRFESGHRQHHARPCDEDHLPLGSGPLYVAALFIINGAPVLVFDILFHTHVLPGALTGYVLFFWVTEAIHWRIHKDQPLLFESWREHHLTHHRRPLVHFNIWHATFDRLFYTQER